MTEDPTTDVITGEWSRVWGHKRHRSVSFLSDFEEDRMTDVITGEWSRVWGHKGHWAISILTGFEEDFDLEWVGVSERMIWHLRDLEDRVLRRSLRGRLRGSG